MKIFVSHPYISDPPGNMRKVDIICKVLASEGHLPISPLHLFSFLGDDDSQRADIMQTCYRLIDHCDIVHVYGDSTGCQQELEYAKATGKKWRVMY